MWLCCTTIFVHRRFYTKVLIEKYLVMARPIADTPILYGADAERFESIIQNTEPYSNEKKEQLRKTYEDFKRKVKIML